MCRHLIDGGHEVRGYDLDRERAHTATSGGGSVDAPRDLVGWAEIIITMLPSGSALTGLLQGPQGLLNFWEAGLALVDMGTTSPTTAQALAGELTSRGGRYLEAPVSGGTSGALAATLTIMAAGDRELFDQISPVLALLGTKMLFVGPAGVGQTLKLANNLLLAVNVVAVGEAWSLVVASGMDRQAAFEVLTTSSGDSRALRTRVPDSEILPEGPAARDYEPGFRVELMLKDASLAQELADHFGLATPTLHAARNVYARATEAGYGDLDIAIVARQLGERVG